MTEFVCRDIDMWIHQNRALVDDCIEGCLLDSLHVYCRRGEAYIFEDYVNSCASQYRVYWMPYGVDDPAHDAIRARWDALQAASSIA